MCEGEAGGGEGGDCKKEAVRELNFFNRRGEGGTATKRKRSDNEIP